MSKYRINKIGRRVQLVSTHKIGDRVTYEDNLGRKGDGEITKVHSGGEHFRVLITKPLECDETVARWPKGPNGIIIYAHTRELTPLQPAKPLASYGALRRAPSPAT